MAAYRVLDVRKGDEVLVADVRSPQEAAKRALGLELKRSGKTRNLVAKVYSEHPGGVSMVRLYLPVVEPGSTASRAPQAGLPIQGS